MGRLEKMKRLIIEEANKRILKRRNRKSGSRWIDDKRC